MAVTRPLPARRLLLVQTIVASLVLTLIGRLWYVQMLDRNKPVQVAGAVRSGQILVPAARGVVLDAKGRVLIGNTTTQVVTVDREVVQSQPDGGTAVLTRLAGLLGAKPASLAREITPCGVDTPAPCWTGQPYQPVPVATGISAKVLLALTEHREDYPGVSVVTQTVREYPNAATAGQVLGYAGPVTADDEKANPSLHDEDLIGRAGLEESYDAVLRGVDGSRTVSLNARGDVVAQGPVVAATPGQTLITSIDLQVQKLAEQVLQKQIAATRASGKPATGGALVVMDPWTGRIVAAASYPDYNPQLFVGGISEADYRKLLDPAANNPLLSRAIAGQYAPGSTFKLISASSDVTHDLATLDGQYSCPGSLQVDGRTKTNFDSESIPGPVDLKLALQYSCDTWFYRFAVQEYYADQARVAAGEKPREYLQAMARAFGFASAPGVDLPADEQAAGSIGDRSTRMARWKQNRAQYCADAKRGFPDEKDPVVRRYLTQLAKENCTDGWRYRAGDNADLAIGQGDTTVSPLQLAVAYSAMINGGTVWKPTFGWAVADTNGKIVRTIKPTVKGHVPVSKAVLNYFRTALTFQDNHQVSGALAFDGSPVKTQLGGKTGTAEVFGKQDTSWLAAWGPSGNDGRPKLVVVGMIEEGGLGAYAAAPMVRALYDGMLGVTGSALPGGRPATTLPAPTARLASVPVPRMAPVEPGRGAPRPDLDGPDAVPTPAGGRR
jgi:penicillin-binding protein 2